MPPPTTYVVPVGPTIERVVVLRVPASLSPCRLNFAGPPGSQSPGQASVPVADAAAAKLPANPSASRSPVVTHVTATVPLDAVHVANNFTYVINSSGSYVVTSNGDFVVTSVLGANTESPARLREAMRGAGLRETRFRFDNEGTKVLLS